MTAGVPGTGIGGLFYLIAAVFLPLRGLAMRRLGARVAWRTIMRQTGLAIAVFVGIWATGWLVGFMLGPAANSAPLAVAGAAASQAQFQNVLRWAALIAGFATLAFVLGAVQVARLVVRPRAR